MLSFTDLHRGLAPLDPQVSGPSFNNTPTTGGGFAAAPTLGGESGAGNRPRPHAGWWIAGAFVLFVLFWVAVIAVIAVIASLPGCTSAQEAGAGADLTKLSDGLQSANTALVGSATTRPSGVVQVFDAAVPAASPYVTLAGLALSGAAAVAGVAGGWLTSRSKSAPQIASLTQDVATHQTAIAEILGDVESWFHPTTSWSTSIEKLITDIAGVATAAPSAPITIASLPVSSAVLETPTAKPPAASS